MRIQSPAVIADAGPAPALTRLHAERRRPDRFELGVLAIFAAISVWVVALDLWHAAGSGLVWTGTDGFYIVDQMQYLSWIQSASHHLLISNLFVLRSTPADYFQPAIAISGAITALGVAPWLALLVWKPVAVLGMFFAIRAVAHRSFTGRFQRRAALVLGLLFGSFSVISGSLGYVGDMMPSWLSWGYPFGLLGVSLIVFAMLGYDRARADGRLAWAPALLGAVAGMVHPWQGELMILIIVGAELVRWRDGLLWWQTGQWRRLALPVLTLLGTGLPLVYYEALGRLDLSWNLARGASKHTFPLSSIALGIAPLAIVALLGYRRRPADFFELLLRLWAPAALVIYVLSATALSATPLHAFDGITIPLAVLAVKGVQRSRRLRTIPRARLAAGAAIALGVVPVNVYALATAGQYVDPTAGNANFITHGERAALDYLNADRTPGGVLTQFYLGEVVPARTGRHTLVGDCLWSEPNCMPRAITADALFDGSLSRTAARTFVRRTGARFILSSCKPHADLRPELGSLIVSTRTFGCATVYQLDPPADAKGPLAELPPDAALRAPWR
ncbi:MAG: hypothetical protein ABSH51_10615 [Solirubrobacteraceae bacterium]